MEEITFERQPIMRYVYHFDNEITTESVQKVIDLLSNFPSVDLFFTTVGGSGPAMNILIHFINNHPDIKIYLSCYICSAGTFLLTDCKKEIIFTDDLEFILFHMGDREVEGQFRKRKLNSDILYEQLKIQNQRWGETFEKIGLNKKEMKAFFDGDDVILYKKDFKRLRINQK